MRPLALLLAAASFALLAPPAHADAAATTLHITKAQFQLYRDYQAALKDPRVIRMKPRHRLPAIARNFHVRLSKLKAAIAVGTKEADKVQAVELAALKKAFKGSPLQGRIGDIRVDASAGRIIAYVQWMNRDPKKLDQEACWAAARAEKAAPLVGTFDLYAQDAANKSKRVFSALIEGELARDIREDQIVDYATTRYERLFEQRKVAAN